MTNVHVHRCTPDYIGPKCDLKREQTHVNSNAAHVNTHSQSSSSAEDSAPYVILSLTLAFILLAVSLITILLAIKLYRLSGAPRIKRRVIVARKNSRGAHDSRNGPQHQTVSEMIDIENCCNMNICETVRDSINLHFFTCQMFPNNSLN